MSVGTVASPVTKMLSVSGKLWCGCHNSVKVLNTHTLDIEHTFTVSSDTSRAVSCMANSGGLGVWISLHNSAVLRLFHSGNYECLTDINIAPAVTKMLASKFQILNNWKPFIRVLFNYFYSGHSQISLVLYKLIFILILKSRLILLAC